MEMNECEAKIPRIEQSVEINSQLLPLVSSKFYLIDELYVFFKKYVIGSGSFGKVLYGIDFKRENEFAIKFEKNEKHSVLKEEIKILKDLEGGEGIPNVYWCGKWSTYKVMVMDLLGPSLDKFFKICGKRFQIETTAILGVEMINRIEYVHSRNFLHRDIKPNNFLIGKFSSRNSSFIDNTVYIIDFGLSKSYIKQDTGLHYDYKTQRRFVGTPRYASINTHIGIRQSRRDDLESILYVLFYFMNGELPWQGIRAKTKSEKKQKIKFKKQTVRMDELCKFELKEMTTLLNYVKNLKFEEKPDYSYIRSLLKAMMGNKAYDLSKYEWEWDKTFIEESKGLTKYVENMKNFEKLYEGYPVIKFKDYIKYKQGLRCNVNSI